MKKKEYRSGTKVFDWKIPPEWNVKDAYIITPDGKKILSFKNNNLHLLNYSIPFNGTVTLDVLKKNL
jgi:aminopeptidase-like protein